MKSKRFFWGLLALLIVGSLLLGACGGKTEDTPVVDDGMAHEGVADLEGRVVTVAVENAYLPFNYIDPDTGEPAGWDYDVWDAICEEINCVPEYVETSWEGMIQAVSDGQYDAAADGITITEERAEIVDFSVGYVAIEQRLLVRIDEDRFDDIEGIVADETLKLGTQTGTTNYATAATYLPEERIQAFEQFGFVVQAVIAGDIDAVIMDETAGQGYLGENKESLKLIGPSLSSDFLGFIFPKGSEIVAAVDLAIEELARNGFLDEVNAKYFGPDFNIGYDDLFPPDPETMLDLSGVTVQFWHVYGEGDPRNEAVLAYVDEFNTTNEYGITVEALDQGQYNDLEDKVNAGIQSGDIPQIAQAYTSALNNWDTVELVVDLNQFVTDETYGLTADEIADIYPGVYALGVTPDGARLGWPISQSANVMVYNDTWAQELGFPARPTTLEDFKAQVCAAAEANANDADPDNDGTGGMVWIPSASNYLSFLHAFGGTELNADGTAYDFNTEAAKAAALYVNGLKASGCAFETESPYPNPEQAQRLALVTLSSTSGLKYYGYAFADAESDDEWGFLAFPGPDGGQGVDAFTQTVGILKSTPEQELASWLFIKFLTSPANQATWIEASGYLPTQYSVEGMLVDYIAAVPQYKSTLALAALGQGEPETFAAWYSVRRAVGDAAALLYAAETPEEVEAILAELTITAAELVAELE